MVERNYCVVKFIGTESEVEYVECVPSKWVTDCCQFLFWPPSDTKTDKMRKMIHKLAEPQETWTKIKIKLLKFAGKLICLLNCVDIFLYI